MMAILKKKTKKTFEPKKFQFMLNRVKKKKKKPTNFESMSHPVTSEVTSPKRKRKTREKSDHDFIPVSQTNGILFV